jgi:hypothetical protein
MSSIKLQGSTSGEITISAPAVAGTNTLTLPATTGSLMTSTFTGDINFDSDTLVVDSTNNRVGIGTSSPSTQLQVTNNSTISIDVSDAQYPVIGNISSGIDDLVVASWGDVIINADYNGNTGQNIIFKEGSSEHMRIDSSGEVSIDSGYLTLNGNEIGGAQITIADNAVGTVVPPRNGGFLMLTVAGNGSYPNEASSAFLAFDVGNSLRTNIARSMSGSFDTAVEVATGALTGTSATDGNIKVSSNTGQVEINNRLGSTQTFQLTFL